MFRTFSSDGSEGPFCGSLPPRSQGAGMKRWLVLLCGCVITAAFAHPVRPLPMHPLLRLAGGICLPLWLTTGSLALGPFEVAKPLPAEEFAKKLDESRQEALRRYPDLAKPESLFARAAKLVEDRYRRDDPDYAASDWSYPLSIAREVAKRMRVFSPVDPLFSEVVPVFTTKKGDRYAQLKVRKIHRDGISIVHEGGTGFIHRDDLSDPQRDKYSTRWDTELLEPAQLIARVEAASAERDRNLDFFTAGAKMQHEKGLAQAKFDFQREFWERSYERSQAQIIRQYCDQFSLRLFELAYSAQESGQSEAMARIEQELAEPVPHAYKMRLMGLDAQIKIRMASYEETYALLRDNRWELMRDRKRLLVGIPKRGQFDVGRLDVPAPEHVRITYALPNAYSSWVFKLDPKSGVATLLPEASKDEGGGTVSFRIVK